MMPEKPKTDLQETTEKKPKGWSAMPLAVRMLIGAVAGGLFGLARYKFVGCRTGACPLTGNPYIATFIWAMIGVALAAK